MHVFGKFAPLSVVEAEVLELWSSGCIAPLGVPHDLLIHFIDVLWRLSQMHQINSVLLRICFLLQLLPRVVCIEELELELLERGFTFFNWIFAIEHCQHLIALLNLRFVQSNRDKLASLDLFLIDPLGELFARFL